MSATSAYAEAQMTLKDSIREIHAMAGFDRSTRELQRPHVAVGVTSPHFGDGKTTVAIGLAGAISEDYGTDVTLVDADFHTHSVGSDFGLDGGEGLAEVLAGRQSLEQVTHRVARARMSVVPAGGISGDPARLARSEHLLTLIENMKRGSDYVIIDLPAALHSMNTPVLASRCDGVIVVVRYGHTSKVDLERTLHLLRDVNVLGVVVNQRKSSVPGWIQRALGLRRS